jgi:hypothetical protein
MRKPLPFSVIRIHSNQELNQVRDFLKRNFIPFFWEDRILESIRWTCISNLGRHLPSDYTLDSVEEDWPLNKSKLYFTRLIDNKKFCLFLVGEKWKVRESK